MSYELSSGVGQKIYSAKREDQDIFDGQHTLQVLSLKKIGKNQENPEQTADRYRVVLSDGTHFFQAMLATQLNEMANEEILRRNTIICAERLSCNYVQDKRLLILMSLRVLAQSDGKIGDPISLDVPNAARSSTSSTSTSTSPAPTKATATSTPAQSSSNRPLTRMNWLPIEALSPYQNNWTIKARVTQKSDLKTYSNHRGEGKLFNVTFMDETGEIRGTAFNQVADTLFSRLEEGKVYYVSKGKVNLAKKKFSNVMNDFELNFEKNTEVEECLETTNLPMIKYSFVTLAELQDVAKDSTCDIIAVLKEYTDVAEIVSKATNRSLKKRELTLVDPSGFSVRLTLWGNQAENFQPEHENVVIAFKGVKVGDFNGRSLSMGGTSVLTQNPDISECHALRGWYDQLENGASFKAHSGGNFQGGTGSGFNRSEQKNLAEMKEEANRMPDVEDKAVYFSTKATIMHIKSENIAYPACQTCNKKVVDDGDGWKCDKCDKTWEKPTYRYILSFAVSDHSDQLWFQGFNEAGVIIFGKDADELIEIRERDDVEFNQVMSQAVCRTYNFLLRAKRDSYNDNTRIRYGVSRIVPLNYGEECKFLLDLMGSSWGQQSYGSESSDAMQH
ncbi:hypothetical protein D9757_006515 [Collybiopsis confluens]|uniref:Replication protein A subunit n=1 Tax=Collybiopsis confluens TaxID=2823264 RepID=A0A8H5HQC0_9AGAR|nr:hypothetical protein D9757_006515 [Collybiopsis confluens]